MNSKQISGAQTMGLGGFYSTALFPEGWIMFALKALAAQTMSPLILSQCQGQQEITTMNNTTTGYTVLMFSIPA